MKKTLTISMVALTLAAAGAAAVQAQEEAAPSSALQELRWGWGGDDCGQDGRHGGD